MDIPRVRPGRISVRVFRFDEIVAAHRYMESNFATGKLVVALD
ncbi:MAG: zinc-binding dehydrogenase [Gammaproteobacteria bacterium]|nr:zinc-binding dehydrogenase [Gammaproteobacteria bacterium]